jgi:uncharacterized protein (TIGR03437 family)
MQNRSFAAVAFLLTFVFLAPAQPAQPSRIAGTIDNSRRVVLPGHLNPRAQAGTDQGPVDSSLPLPYVTLVLKPSAGQQADLDQLLAQQQDPSSSNYHRWLTPEEYADRFGVSQDDIAKIVAWLQQQQFTVKAIARGRNAVSFGGTAGQIETAFATTIHRYQVDGELHFANATEPSVPAALQGVVSAIHGLNDFRLRARQRSALSPRNTTPGGNHQLAPDDIATIYDIKPLYSAGIDGSGQKLVVAGQTQINLSDIEQFRSYFNLAANDPQVMLVPNTKDPGISSGDLVEADLDLELSGAVARNAHIIFVYSYDVMDAAQYAIDQNLAPVLSISYGNCELQTDPSDASTMQSWAQQGNAQGITWFAASADDGGADCYGGDSRATNDSLSVDLPAAIPEVTGVGGTEFNEGGGNYWSGTNNSNHASALSYIPEIAWNDTAIDDTPSASGGGASIYFTKPSWQTGTGVPNDGARDVPDVAISASADHDGYMVYSGGAFSIVAGTSAGPPNFAGIATLLNQYLVANGVQKSAGLGNMNPRFYTLAQTTGVFHDITTGNNLVNPCTGQHQSCSSGSIGYSAGVGYDQVTGLGTPDVYNLVMAWHESGAVSKSAASLALLSSATSLTFGATATLTVAATGANGGMPTGTVTFSLAGVSLGTATLSGSGGSATASFTMYGILLTSGANAITAQYSGDSQYDSASATVTITVAAVVSGVPSITGLANGASFTPTYAPGGILTVFGKQLAPATGSAPQVPLPNRMAGVSATINGIAAPLYYVSPSQLNIQIPYGIPPNTRVTLTVSSNGQSAFDSFPIAATAPGIFVSSGGAPVPFATAARGEVVTLFITGAGAVSPSVSTGAAPASGTAIADLPEPVGAVTVTVGGVTAPIQFAGIPLALVGVVQINYQVPSQAPLGAQSVVVSVGGISSAAATFNVTE